MKQKLLSTLKYLVLGIFSCYFIIWLLSPIIIPTLAKQQLTNVNLSLGEHSHIRYNPFISSLAVKNLSIYKEQRQMFAIDRLELELNLSQLLFKRLYVKSFDIKGLYLDVTFIDNNWHIAGIKLEDTKENTTTERNAQDDIQLYQLIMPNLQLTQSKLQLTAPQHQQTINLDQLVITNLAANAQQQSANLDIILAIDNAKLRNQAQINKVADSTKLANQLSIEQFPLSAIAPWLPPEFSSLSGTLNFNGQQALNLAAGQGLITLKDSLQSLENFSMTSQGVTVNTLKQSLTSPLLTVTLLPNNEVKIDGTIETDIEEIQINSNRDQQKVLAAIEQLTSGAITISYDQQLPHLALSKLTLENAIISQDQTLELPAFSQFKQLVMSGIQVSTSTTSVEVISISALTTNITLDAQKNIANLSPVTSLASNKATTEAQDNSKQNQETDTDAETAPYPIRINTFQLIDGSNIYFTDTSVDPAYQRVFTIDEMSLGPIDTASPELTTNFTLAGTSNNYTTFSFLGSGKAFSSEPKFSLNGKIKELNLPDVSTYIKDALKYEIKSGHLDLALDAQLKGEQISGSVDVLLQGIDLTAADDHEADSLSDKSAIPFSAAIGMLKDSKGNVELTIPLSGKTSDPSFGTSGIMALLIKQATMMAAKDYLMTTFVPYAKVVSVALAAGSQMLKLRFNDLIYPPTQVELGQEQHGFLQQFASLMKEKKDTKITLCAIATPQDIAKPAGSKINQKEDINQLHKISQARLDNFKHRMVTDYQLKSSRLLLCTPQIDTSANAKPRLTFVSH